MTAAPDLTTKQGRDAYRRELRGIARPIRIFALGLTFAGLAVAIVRVVAVPAMPAAVPAAILGLGVFHMIVAVAVRARYHQRRTRPGLVVE